MESFVCHNPKLGEIESLNGYNWRPCQDRTTEESTWHILRYAEGKIEPATAGWEQMQPTVRDRGTVVPNPEADLRARLLDAERQSTELISEMERANEEAKRVREELQQALGEIQFCKNEVEGLRAEYEKLSMLSELDKLRALDLLIMRQESEKRMADERTRADAELRRSDSYISVLQEKFQFEKQGLEKRVYALEENCRCRSARKCWLNHKVVIRLGVMGALVVLVLVWNVR